MSPIQPRPRRQDSPVDVAKTVQSRLDKSAYRILRTISFDFEHGSLILRGRLPSYFHKQLAQEAVREVEGVSQVINRIDVRPALSR